MSLSTQYLFASKICWQVKRIKRPYMDGCTIYLIPKTLYPVLQRQSLDMHMCSVNNLHWIDNANGWEHKRDLAFKHFPPLLQIFVIKKNIFAWNSSNFNHGWMGFYDCCCCHCSVPPNIDPIVLPLIFFFSSCPLFGFFLSSKGIWCLVGKTWVATLHQARWDLFLKVWKSNLDLKSQARQLLNPCLSILLLFFRNCGVFFSFVIVPTFFVS